MKKLIPNLYNKTNYVVHYRNLQFYIEQGLVLKKIHKDLCTAQRQNATSQFESDLAKLQANSTFGKTMENVRIRANIRLIADSVKLRKAVSKPSYLHAQIINQDLVMVREPLQ